MGAWKYQIYFSCFEINLVFPRTMYYSLYISRTEAKWSFGDDNSEDIEGMA
jgi:hypothetical protein